jgi:hypothetical protein
MTLPKDKASGYGGLLSSVFLTWVLFCGFLAFATLDPSIQAKLPPEIGQGVDTLRSIVQPFLYRPIHFS